MADPEQETGDVQGGSSGATPVQEVHVLVCAFSPDGSYIVAGANDCHCYVWSWDALKQLPQPASSATPRDPDQIVASMEAVAKLPGPALITRAPGHSKDVILLQFSSDGSGFATGSRDETLRVGPPPPVPMWGRLRGKCLQSANQSCYIVNFKYSTCTRGSRRKNTKHSQPIWNWGVRVLGGGGGTDFCSWFGIDERD
jgi:WD40 repeat protein